jgi:hypothetical protein
MAEEDSGPDGQEATAEATLSPATAFELLAHETRVGVLETLQEAGGGPLSFGDIRDSVGIDDPGQCHYHVDRLRGQFVHKTEGGYELSPVGWQLVGAILSGTVTSSLPDRTVPSPGNCADCGGDLVAGLRASGVTIECVDCGFVQTDPDVPPGIFEGWSDEEIPAVLGQYLRRWESDAAHGFCPNCEGRVDRVVTAPGEEGAPDWFERGGPAALVVTTCRRCGYWWHGFPPIPALVEPAVVAFHHEHGIDLRDQPWWALDHLELGAGTLTADPRRLHIPIEIDGDRRTFVFDGEFQFVEERQD